MRQAIAERSRRAAAPATEDAVLSKVTFRPEARGEAVFLSIDVDPATPHVTISHEVPNSINDLAEKIGSFIDQNIHPRPEYGLRAKSYESVSLAGLLNDLQISGKIFDKWSQPQGGGPLGLMLRTHAISVAADTKHLSLHLVREYGRSTVGEDSLEGLLGTLIDFQAQLRRQAVEIDKVASSVALSMAGN